MRLLQTCVFVLMTSLVFGQKSELFQNINARAHELKHHLNETGDSLVFKCERTIFEVVIYNDDFQRFIRVMNSEVVIPIADIPQGKYVVEALLKDKLIVMTLLRHQSFDLPDAPPMLVDNTNLFGKKVIEKKLAVVIPKAKLKSKSIGKDKFANKTDLAVAGKKAKPIARRVKKREPKPEEQIISTKKVIAKYWVVYKINKGTSTEKIQKIADQEAVDRMIRKIEIDMKTKAGRLNELIVWTVYDASKFVKHKRKNRSDFMNIASESFKIEPYYEKVSEPNNL